MVPHPGAHFMGHFKNGQAVGNFWIGLSNNGFINGFITNANGDISGRNISYIYPDGVTALHGTFKKGFMKR